jgi:signal transduction histidine kinase
MIKLIKRFYSSTFLALIYMVLFTSSVLLLLNFIYWATAGYMARQTDASIEAELTVLAEQYRQQGLTRLVMLISERIAQDTKDSSLYLFTAADSTPLAGNLNHRPKVAQTPGGWLNFQMTDKPHPARARTLVLQGGLHLLVGRDIQELKKIQALILNALSWGLAFTLGLALIGGLVISWIRGRRIKAINQTSRQIMTGDLSGRIPTKGWGDGLDQLADNLNAMLDQIEKLMAGVQQISDNIAFELKIPLTQLRNRLEQMWWQKPGTETEQYNKQLEESIAEADQLLSTFNALLYLARIESGSFHSRQETVDLKTLVRDAYQLYEPLAEEKNQSFTIQLDTGLLEVHGDRDILFQALTNLLDNAVKYTPSGGQIIMTLGRNNGIIEIIVADTGPGIPDAAREHVWERFYRLEASRSTPGNGLGLSLVAAVATRYNAQMRLEDNAPGLRVVFAFGS